MYFSNDLKQVLTKCVTQASVWSSRILSLSKKEKCGQSLGFSGMDWKGGFEYWVQIQSLQYINSLGSGQVL